MKTILSAALAASVAVGIVGLPNQAQATDPVAVAAGLAFKLFLFAPRTQNPGTSANTHYALTGQGVPVRSKNQPPVTAPVIHKHPPQVHHCSYGCGYHKKW